MVPRERPAADISPIDAVGWLPDYQRVFGSPCTFGQLLSWVQSYPAQQWLFILSRIQTSIAGNRSHDSTWVGPMANGMLPRSQRQQLLRLARESDGSGLRGVFHDHQASVLQQLVILQSPRECESTFASEEDFDVLGRALFAVFSQLHPDPADESQGEDHTIQALIHDFYRTHPTPLPLYIMRAFELWQLAQRGPSPDVAELFRLFREATDLEADQYILGGLAYFTNEVTKSADDLAIGTSAYPPISDYANTRERECRHAYIRISSNSLEQIREKALEKDGATDDISQWSLVAMKSSPMMALGDGRHIILSLTYLAQSMVSGVRHTIRTAALDGALRPGWNGRRGLQRIEGCFGRVFETYIENLLRHICGTHIEPIPESTTRRADFLAVGDGVVAVMEVKSGLFRAIQHSQPLSISERRAEVASRLRSGLTQLSRTIGALRRGDIRFPDDLRVDWTTTPIVPVLITEERLPVSPVIWEHLIDPLIPEDLSVGTGLPAGALRIISMSELETHLDTLSKIDLARELYAWSCDHEYDTAPFATWVRKRELPTGGALNDERFQNVRDYVARTLQLTS